MVVEPLTPPGPAVIVVEFVEPVFGPPCLVVTTRHGLPLVTTVPSGPEVTATLSASAGAAAARNPIVKTRMAVLWTRIIKSSADCECHGAGPVAIARERGRFIR